MNGDLSEFVREVLVQIIQGIGEAQIAAHKMGAAINPQLAQVKNLDINTPQVYKLDRENLKASGILETLTGGIADMIEFDIAITTAAVQSAGSETDSRKEGALRVQVVSASLGGGSKSNQKLETTDSKISRVKFKVPVRFPVGKG